MNGRPFSGGKTVAFPISDETWRNLVQANENAVAAGWAERGVFATGVGLDFVPGDPTSLLYVGKSAGPLGSLVGSVYDQQASAKASEAWMTQRRNERSPFWQFIEKIDPWRRSIAWTNVCKMDRIGGGMQPSGRLWDGISAHCIQALKEELSALRPKVTVFAISENYRPDVQRLLTLTGYEPHTSPDLRGELMAPFMNREGQVAFLMRHPQGWNGADRDRALACIRRAIA